MPSTLHITVMRFLAWLIAPLAIGSAVLVTAQWLDARHQAERELEGWAVGIVHTVELRLNHFRTQLEAIAALQAIDQADLAEVRRFAKRVIADQPDAVVMLVDPHGEVVVETVAPIGTRLPNLWQLEDDQASAVWNGNTLPMSDSSLTREVFRTGEAGFSGLYLGPNSKRPRLAVAVPVRRDGKVIYALRLSYSPTVIDELLARAALVGEMHTVLLDKSGRVVGSNGLSPYSIGQSPALPQPSRYVVENAEPDGSVTVGLHSRTNAGYTLWIDMPRAVVYGSARNSAIGWFLLALAAVLLSILAAARFNRRLAEPLRQLAESVAEGQTSASIAATNIHEIDLLAGALRTAAEHDKLRHEEEIKHIQAEKHHEAIHTSEKLIREIFASLEISVAVLDSQGVVVELNHPPAHTRTRIPAARGQLFWDCEWWSYDPAVQRLVRDSVTEVMAGREGVRFNLPARIEDGRLLMIDFQLSTLRQDERGAVTHLIASAVDVQDRVDAIKSLAAREAESRQLAKSLDDQRRLLDAALQASPAGMIISDASGSLLRMNQATLDLWGSAPLSASVKEYAAWKGWWPQGHERDGQPVQANEWPLARALQSAKLETSVVDIEPFGAPGTRKTVQISAAPVLDNQGRVYGGVSVSVDITDRVHAEAVLREADRHKDEFLATLGHELRNPLGPIRSAIQIIRKYPAVEPVVIRAQEVIERQTAHMNRLVDDLLDLARIAKGSLRMEQEIVDLRDIAVAAAEAVSPALEAKGVRLRRDLAEAPTLVRGDATRLSQALINLLTNACKFTPGGGLISLRLRRSDSTAIVEVEDTGIGLAPESLERIFGLFVQEQPHGAAARMGLGIGLALSRRLLAMHGGELRAASPGLGHGSTFTAQLPLLEKPVEISAPSIRTGQDRRGPRPRLLLVDDNRDSCDLFKELMQLADFDVDTAYDGSTALSAAERARYNAFVLDIGLPDMNGYELCRRLRLQVGSVPVIVALTGWGQPEDRKAAEEAGFDTHLTKPIDADVVCGVLATFLKARRAAVGIMSTAS